MDASLSRTFNAFLDSEKAGAVLLIVCTAVALGIAQTPVAAGYSAFWQTRIAGLSLEHIANDALMAVFFLLVGLELERELYSGELSNVRNALLPVFAAAGGMAVPALVHFSLNAGTPAQAGIGIPTATDIAFALGALSLLGKRVPASLKVFLTALAVMDDLGAIVVIALFYTKQLSVVHLTAALGVFVALCALNAIFRVTALLPYLIGGAVMWFLMLQSGVHATIAGVLLAFAIPYSSRAEDAKSPSHRLEHFIAKPVAFVVLPVFALANTGIAIGASWRDELMSANSVGIVAGLVLGKPVGIVLFSFIAVALGVSILPRELRWRHIVGAGLLGGIGFTMSIFITILAFGASADLVNASKLAILLASLTAGLLGYLWLRYVG
jgi:NhaA family Na+:H+ antiporter